VEVNVSRLLVLSLALVLAACAARSKSGKRASSSDDGDFKQWGSQSSEPSKEEDDEPEYKDPKREALPEGPSCLDTKGDVQECLADSDCCKGFYCGIDPAGSPRIKVCLYGGK
jgi:hypothetical protein